MLAVEAASESHDPIKVLTARVDIGNRDSPEVFIVPIRYLVPVPPTRPGSRVVALDGAYKGVVLLLRERAMETWLVTTEDKLQFDDISEDRLVVYDPTEVPE